MVGGFARNPQAHFGLLILPRSETSGRVKIFTGIHVGRVATGVFVAAKPAFLIFTLFAMPNFKKKFSPTKNNFCVAPDPTVARYRQGTNMAACTRAQVLVDE